MKKRTARGLFYFPDPKNRPQAHTFGCVGTKSKRLPFLPQLSEVRY